MVNLSQFRKDKFLQYEYALATGCTVSKLLKKSSGLHGNTGFNSFLNSTFSSVSPIDWLEQDEILDASVNNLKAVAKFLTDLEDWLELSSFEVLNGLSRKHNSSTLKSIFKATNNDKWGSVTRGQIEGLLKEFFWWCSEIDTLDVFNQEIESAKTLLSIIEQPLFKQLKTLGQVVEVSSANWQQDEDVFNNIMSQIYSSNKLFVQEWLSSDRLHEHYNVKTNRAYTSLYSWLILSLIAGVRNYKHNLWATRKQWESLGYKIKNDASPAAVFHYFKVNNENEFEEIEESNASFGRKVSLVYNADEVLGLEGKSYKETKVKSVPILEQRIKELGVDVRQVINEAYYNCAEDYINMPPIEAFKAKDSTKDYYATLLHEMVHWTGHKSRCNRGLETALSPKQRAIEELVAEIGSTFLCARFGITKKVRPQSISYIENWLDGLGWCDFIDYLEQAAMLANRASNYIYVPKRDDI